jgi:protease II
MKNTEVILDIEEVPFVPPKMLRKTLVDKAKMNDDHSLVGFTLDIGGNERLTAGIKDMVKGEVLKNVKLERISGLEFGTGKDTLFYVETDAMNRPFQVRRLTLSTMKEQIVFVD